MALFMDGRISGMEDLTAQDTQLTNVANVEGIDVTQKLVLAQNELALELEAMLEGSRDSERAAWYPPGPTIGNVVVTPALKLWHTFRALEMVYRDAYSNQLNDRYAAKRDQFQERTRWAQEKLAQMGIGLVWRPVGQAAAPTLVSAQGGLPDDTYYVTVTWCNTIGEEGGPSLPAVITTVGSTLLVQTGPRPPSIAGWNVYIGLDPTATELQNGSPIADGETWLAPDRIVEGLRSSGGQLPNYLKPVTRRIWRG